MTDRAKSKNKPKSDQTREVLASLPNRRPQRLTAKRAATREQAKLASATTPARKSKPLAAAGKLAASTPPASAPTPPAGARAAPRQGFESEEIIAGVAVTPPSGSEMVVSVLELGASVAQGALSKGAQLVLGTLQRLPRI
ncbi:MAG TPA: hypothetical protein VID48_10575 [Solirubrobacteraceae bacterium]|jgi:hypothetical protein